VTEELRAATFAPHEGSTFTASDGATSVPLVLAEVEELPAQQGAPRQDPFRLTFTGTAGTAFEQGTYRLDHDKLGQLEMFLIPRKPEADGLPRLEGLFN
jgi:hypothetical protein